MDQPQTGGRSPGTSPDQASQLQRLPGSSPAQAGSPPLLLRSPARPASRVYSQWWNRYATLFPGTQPSPLARLPIHANTPEGTPSAKVETPHTDRRQPVLAVSFHA